MVPRPTLKKIAFLNQGLMKRIFCAGVVCALLAGCFSAAEAQTNLEYWSEEVNINLTGLTNGIPRTNGLVATVAASAGRISSKDIIRALQNKTVQAITKQTNDSVAAFPLFTPTNTAFSSAAKLLFLQPAGTNGLGPLLVIRDQQPPVDFDVGAYFSFSKVSFDGRSDPLIIQGRFDRDHDLAAAVNHGIERVVFDADGFSGTPIETYFDVQGLVREQETSLTKGSQILSHHLIRATVAQVAGTGQINGTNGFAIFQGTISFSGGRHESK
jgi:hypothetical protein